VTLILGFCIALFSSAVAAEIKIGIVDLQKALNESEAGKQAKKDLEEIIKAKQKLIDQKGREIEKLKEEIDKQASVLSEKALRQKQDELDRKMRDYKRFVQDAQDEVKRKEAQLTEEILKELRKVIDEIGKKENFTLILEKVEGVVLYIDETVDITQKVIETYNKKIKKNK
jgi:outer membrane protein